MNGEAILARDAFLALACAQTRQDIAANLVEPSRRLVNILHNRSEQLRAANAFNASPQGWLIQTQLGEGW